MREMKDSGIEWIGQIPKDWTLLPIKYVFNINRGRVISALHLVEDGKYPVYSSQTENNGCFGYLNTYDFEGPAITWTTDGAKAGSVFYRDGRYNCTNVCGILQLNDNYKDVNLHFATYAIAVVAQQNKRYDINGFKIMSNEMARIKFAIPDIVVQQQIADFLDTQCFEIDATAEDIQKEISLLEDYKKSVITEAVTKGLNPDAEMKDSKIFYLGQINKTWNLTKVGYCCKKLYRPFEPSDEALVCSNKGKVVPRDDTLIGLMTSDDNAMQGICKGDIAIHGMDTWHGAIACSEYDGKITRVVHVCKADGDNRFVVYWLQHLAFVGVYKLISNGVRGNTSDFRSWDKVADIYIPNPIKEEQQQIADFLDSKCSEIDYLIADKKRQLDILADYKKSLIYEYVTGKKEVPVNE